MRYSDRIYNIGDRVFFLAQYLLETAREGQWEITEDLPLYHSSQYGYAVVEGIVSSIMLPFLPFGREANETHGYMNGVQLYHMRGRDGRLIGFMYNTDPVTASDVNIMLNNNEPDLDKRAFLKQFLLPLVISTAQYNKLLTDIANASGRDPATVVSADKESIVRRAQELDIPVRLIDPNSPAFKSQMNPASASVFREWDTTGVPNTSTMTSPAPASEPDFDYDDETEEEDDE